MLVLRFLRFLFGYVSFTARKGFPERFINLCRNRNINLWNLRSDNGIISACTDSMNYRKIRPVARKSGMHVRIKRKYGLPFFLNRHSHRVGILFGVCFCVAAICILSTRIWSVDVIGNVRVPSEKIIGVFEELGVRKGISGERIDIQSVEIAALQKLPEISWLNINFDGSAALIEVRETDENTSAEDDTPSDIVASRDGQIVILRPFNGTQEQKIGNPVLKGDLLISGIKENKDLTVSFCRAKGYVVAKTKRNISAEQKNTFKAYKKVSEKNSYIIDFLFFSIPIGKSEKSAYKEKSSLRINGVTLPFALTRCSDTQTAVSDISLTEIQTELLSSLHFFDECAYQFKYLKTEKSDISVSKNKNVCTYSGNFICFENIGREIPMDIEETE